MPVRGKTKQIQANLERPFASLRSTPSIYMNEIRCRYCFCRRFLATRLCDGLFLISGFHGDVRVSLLRYSDADPQDAAMDHET